MRFNKLKHQEIILDFKISMLTATPQAQAASIVNIEVL